MAGWLHSTAFILISAVIGCLFGAAIAAFRQSRQTRRGRRPSDKRD